MRDHPNRNTISLTLKPAAPFRLDYTAWALRRRPDNTIDRWDGVARQNVQESSVDAKPGPSDAITRYFIVHLRAFIYLSCFDGLDDQTDRTQLLF